MKVLLPWARTFTGKGRWPAPSPDAEIFRVSFSELPPELVSLPQPLATATSAAITLHERLGNWLTGVGEILTEEGDSGPPLCPKDLLLRWWWGFVAVIEPARTEILKVAKHMNFAQPEMTVLGITAPSVHQVLLNLTTRYSVELLQELGFGCRSADRFRVDLGQVCRTPDGTDSHPDTESMNQLVQDCLLAQREQLCAKFHHLTSDWWEDFTRLKSLLIAETRDAEHRFEWRVDGNGYRVYRVKVRPEWNPGTASVELDGKQMIIKENEWTLLDALAKRRPAGLELWELNELNGDARRVLRELQRAWNKDGGVIVFPGTRGKGGYRLL